MALPDQLARTCLTREVSPVLGGRPWIGGLHELDLALFGGSAQRAQHTLALSSDFLGIGVIPARTKAELLPKGCSLSQDRGLGQQVRALHVVPLSDLDPPTRSQLARLPHTVAKWAENTRAIVACLRPHTVAIAVAVIANVTDLLQQAGCVVQVIMSTASGSPRPKQH